MQNPTRTEVAGARQRTGDTGSPTAKPDYLVEGRVFDCIAPGGDRSVRNIGSDVKTKIDKGQTQRIILNTTDWHGDLNAVRDQFRDWPVDDLKEVIAITKDNDIVRVWHRQEET